MIRDVAFRSTDHLASLTDGRLFDVDGIAVRLKVNPRARRISLRIDARTGEAVAVAPSTRRLSEAVAFARTRPTWFAERLAARRSSCRLSPGGAIEVFGRPHVLRPDGRRPRLADGVLEGCGEGVIDMQLVVRALREASLEFFRNRVIAHCEDLRAPFPIVSLSDARTRWGSCTPPREGRPGSIRLSWRLVLAPRSVADYVVAHECAHLLHANHGPHFWAMVRRLVGDPSHHRAFLRRMGPGLQAFGRPTPQTI